MQKLCNRATELPAHMHQVESNPGQQQPKPLSADNRLAASAEQAGQACST